jgi:hypothetical protein
MTLTDQEKTDTRRFCGYPVWDAASRILIPLGSFPAREFLEYRMNTLTPTDEIALRRFLGNLSALEIGIPRAGENLDTDRAAVWSRNRTEVTDRLRLLKLWCRRFCDFLGVVPGPGLMSDSNPRIKV